MGSADSRRGGLMTPAGWAAKASTPREHVYNPPVAGLLLS
jgi:hypothetical protein